MPEIIPDEFYPALLKQLELPPRGKEVHPAEVRITFDAAEDEADLVDIQAHYTPRDLPYEQYVSAILQLAHHLCQSSSDPISIGRTLQVIATAMAELEAVQDDERRKRNDRCCQNCGAKGSLIDDDSPACGCCSECGQDFFAALKPGESWDYLVNSHQAPPSVSKVSADVHTEDMGNPDDSVF